MIPATGHTFVDGICLECGEKAPAVPEGPVTGDQNQTGLWLALMLVAAACTAGASIAVKKED